MSKQHKTSIGGQAVIEGIMMRGPEKTSLAVRLPNGSLDVETWENPQNYGMVQKNAICPRNI